MKRTLFNWTLVLLSLCIAPKIFATYYIAGNGTDDPNGKWCNGSNWGFNALNANNTITFTGVAVNKSYGFKIRDTNDWNTGSNYLDIDHKNSSPNVYLNGTDISFYLVGINSSTSANITIEVRDEKVIVTVENGKFTIWDCFVLPKGNVNNSWSDKNNTKSDDLKLTTKTDQVKCKRTFSLSAGTYKFVVIDNNWTTEKSWGHEFDLINLDYSTKHIYGGDGADIEFTLTSSANVTIEYNGQYIYVTTEATLTPRYFIAGNGNSGDTWNINNINAWNVRGTALPLSTNSYTFENLGAGSYRFDVTDGYWNNQGNNGEFDHEFYTVDRANSSPHLYGWGEEGQYIQFTLSETANVTIGFNPGTSKITVTTTKPFTAPTYYISGNGNNGDSWTINNQSAWDDFRSTMVNGSKTFANLTGSAGGSTYRFQIIDGYWGNNHQYNLLDSEHSKGNVSGGNGTDVSFTLYVNSDVTINYDGRYITVLVDPILYLTGNGLTADSWNISTTWVPDARPMSYGSITIENLPASDNAYQFKVTTGAWPVDGGAVWGFDNLDAEHSTANVYEGDNHNICFLLNETSNITISFNPETSKITFTSSTALRTPYNIVGAEALTGYNWGYDYDHHNLMSLQGDGTYKLEINNKELNSGTYNFKVIKNHKYAEGYEFPFGEGNNAWITISSQGKYNLVFTFTPDDATTVHCTAYELMDYTISQYGYNTFYYGKAYEVPDGVTAKIVTDVNASGILTYEAISVIPANTGVLLSGTPGDYTFLETTTTDSYATTNKLKGSVSATDIDNSLVHYVLSYDENNQVGFFWPYGTGATNGVGPFTNGANKAYLELGVEQQSSNVIARRGFPFNPQSELPTSVETVSGERLEVSGKILRDGNLLIIRDGRVYNAQGARMK